MTKDSKFSLLVVLVLVVVAACGPGAEPPAEMVSVQLSWLHYGAFGGLYAADLNGEYSAEGLAVRFLQGGPDVDDVGAVVEGQAQFGVAGGDALLLARAQGQPVRAIATIMRRSPVVFVSAVEAGLVRPQDLRGKTIRITPQIEPSLHAMMAHVGIPRDAYAGVILPSELDVFASDQADAWGVYYNSFAVTLREAGYELNYIFPDDYGVHLYSDSLFTTDELIAANPELVSRFLRATLKGLEFAVENPERIGAMVVEYDSGADPALENAKAAASVPLIHTGEDPLGWMRPEAWQGMHDTLLAEGVLTQSLAVEEVYTLKFLRDIYGEDE